MTFSRDLFQRLPVVGILRGFPRSVLKHLIPAVKDGGLTTIEVTMNSEGAPDQIREINELSAGSMNVGAGTVTTMQELEQALDAGASFIVTPIVVPEVIQHCVASKIPVFPGAFTPTEIFQAWTLGADMVKIFPASRLGPSYVKDVKAPLNQIKMLATGGVTIDSLGEWMAAGAEGFGVGSPLFHSDRINNGDWDWVRKQAAGFKAEYDAQKG